MQHTNDCRCDPLPTEWRHKYQWRQKKKSTCNNLPFFVFFSWIVHRWSPWSQDFFGVYDWHQLTAGDRVSPPLMDSQALLPFNCFMYLFLIKSKKLSSDIWDKWKRWENYRGLACRCEIAMEAEVVSCAEGSSQPGYIRRFSKCHPLNF